MDEPKELTEELIFAGVDFIREVTRVYGADKGQAIFEALGPTMGAEVKGAIFMAMLTGETDGIRVVFKIPHASHNMYRKVEAIKALRTATGIGLKDAKDSVERAELTTEMAECKTRDLARELRQALHNLGFEVR